MFFVIKIPSYFVDLVYLFNANRSEESALCIMIKRKCSKAQKYPLSSKRGNSGKVTYEKVDKVMKRTSESRGLKKVKLKIVKAVLEWPNRKSRLGKADSLSPTRSETVTRLGTLAVPDFILPSFSNF